MLYLMTSGCYSSYGVEALFESDLTEEQVEQLYKEYQQRRKDYHQRYNDARDAWIMSHPVLPDGTLINVTHVSPPPWTTDHEVVAAWQKEWPLISKAHQAWDTAHPEQDDDKAWLESQGVHERKFTELHGDD